MSDKSHIEWTDATWNPSTGCTKVSEGCRHCYIDRTPPFRLQGRSFGSEEIGATTGVMLHPDRLDQPLRWERPRRVFVNSLSDLFHEDVPDRFLWRVFASMARSPQHVFQVLTKRPRRMQHLLSNTRWTAYVTAIVGEIVRWPLPNVWLGVSVENQEWADRRIPLLLDTPAAVRFLSCEPLLGPVILEGWLPIASRGDGYVRQKWEAAYGKRRRPRIDWVIVGGESGPKARPMHPDWARSIRDQCVAAGVPFFFKQWGEWSPEYDSATAPEGFVSFDGRLHTDHESTSRSYRPVYVVKVGKKHAGRELDGRTWDEMPDQGVLV